MNEYEYTGKAMGTDFSISVICDSKEIADEIAQIVTKDIYDYENQFSRFKTDSELSKLNEYSCVSSAFACDCAFSISGVLFFELLSLYKYIISIFNSHYF